MKGEKDERRKKNFSVEVVFGIRIRSKGRCALPWDWDRAGIVSEKRAFFYLLVFI